VIFDGGVTDIETLLSLYARCHIDECVVRVINRGLIDFFVQTIITDRRTDVLYKHKAQRTR